MDLVATARRTAIRLSSRYSSVSSDILNVSAPCHVIELLARHWRVPAVYYVLTTLITKLHPGCWIAKTSALVQAHLGTVICGEQNLVREDARRSGLATEIHWSKREGH